MYWSIVLGEGVAQKKQNFREITETAIIVVGQEVFR